MTAPPPAGASLAARPTDARSCARSARSSAPAVRRPVRRDAGLAPRSPESAAPPRPVAPKRHRVQKRMWSKPLSVRRGRWHSGFTRPTKPPESGASPEPTSPRPFPVRREGWTASPKLVPAAPGRLSDSIVAQRLVPQPHHADAALQNQGQLFARPVIRCPPQLWICSYVNTWPSTQTYPTPMHQCPHLPTPHFM
jgi:hypothetical protein